MNTKVGYLGPQGSYSRLAAEKLCRSGNYIDFANFHLLMQALERGAVDCAVLPIENSVNGGVTQNIDLLQEHGNAFAYGECKIKIDHRLVVPAGADLREIRRIYSHGQALGQCAKYINRYFPQAQLVETPSTAGCLELLVDRHCAGIVGSHCRADGFELSKDNIADNKRNYTQFLLVKIVNRPLDGAESVRESLKSNRGKVFFSVTCRHEPGALVRLLTVLSDHSINMTKIESRPIKERVGEYRFFIEIEVGGDGKKVADAAEEIVRSANSFRLLGCY